MAKLIQREGRPDLDLTPDETPNTAGWAEKYIVGANPLNAPVPERKGPPDINGWQHEIFTSTAGEEGENEKD